MPPAHATTIPHRGADGRWRHTFRQSWLDTMLRNPELARHQLYGLTARTETDATMIGTAVHSVIETALQGYIKFGRWHDLADLEITLRVAIDQGTADPDLRWVKRNEHQTERFGLGCVHTWYEQVMPILQPLATEVAFGPVVLWEDDQRVVSLTGTVDYVDAVMGLVDWKTSGRKYDKWEKERWAIQPTVYCAAAHLDAIPVVPVGLRDQFTFVVMVEADPEPQIIRVERPAVEWVPWLKAQIGSMLPLIEANIAPWPFSDQSALCSPKWSPIWDQWKGAHVKTPRWAQL